MLRAILVFALIVVGFLNATRGAFQVLLFYLWIAYFRPDDWVYGSWVRDLNLSLAVGCCVVLVTAFSKERLRFGLGSALMLLFLAHAALTIPYSPAPIDANLWGPWTDFARKVTIGLSLTLLVTTEARLRAVLLVIALSLSFEGAKQGWVHLVIYPGVPNINPSPFLGDNNGVAVGMLMLIPILTALAATSSWRLERYGARFLVVGILYRAISTFSRGGFLAAIALGLHYLVRSKRKVRAVIGLVILVGIVVPALPGSFWRRMGSIQTAAEASNESQLDVSQASRLHFWRVALLMAADRPFLGVGFNGYNDVFDRYDFRHGEFGTQRSVHSVWFGLLAEVGYVGFGLFVLIFARAFYVNWRARRLARLRPDLANLVAYGTAIEAALVTFAVGGSFVPYQYNEMYWHFISMTIVIDRLIRERMALPMPAVTTPGTATVTTRRPPLVPAPAVSGLSPTARAPRSQQPQPRRTTWRDA